MGIIRYKINGVNNLKTGDSRLPVAKRLGEAPMMFMVDPTLGIDTIQYLIDQIKVIMKKHLRRRIARYHCRLKVSARLWYLPAADFLNH